MYIAPRKRHTYSREKKVPLSAEVSSRDFGVSRGREIGSTSYSHLLALGTAMAVSTATANT